VKRGLHFPPQILSAQISARVSLFNGLFSRTNRNFCRHPCKMCVIYTWFWWDLECVEYTV